GVPAPPGARAASRPRQDSEAARRGSLPQRRLRLGAHDRQPRQEAAAQIRGARLRLRRDRHGARPRVSLDRRRGLMRFSRIGWRRLAFNLLLVFLPVAGFIYLDTYEKQLLDAQERAMVQQGRVLSAALSGQGKIERAEADRIVKQLNRRLDARLRVVDGEGFVLADTARFGPREGAARAPAARRTSLLYRVGAFFADLPRRVSPPEAAPEKEEASETRLEGREVRAALAGRYGRAVRETPGERSVTLSSAIPIENAAGGVVGAAVVSQSTQRILRDLYAVRVRIAEVCAASLLAALVLSLFLSATI